MMTNEDYADYVLCIRKIAYQGALRIPYEEAERAINEAYAVFCEEHHLQKIFVPLPFLKAYCPLERIPVPEHLKNIPYMGSHK